MAESINKAEEQVKGCTGDCKVCSMMQRGYCASQIAYNNMKLISQLYVTINEMQAEIKALGSSSVEPLISPIEE